MKYVEEFHDPAPAHRLVEIIKQRATRRWTIMEVCGGQTHSIIRNGIDLVLIYNNTKIDIFFLEKFKNIV